MCVCVTIAELCEGISIGTPCSEELCRQVVSEGDYLLNM